MVTLASGIPPLTNAYQGTRFLSAIIGTPQRVAPFSLHLVASQRWNILAALITYTAIAHGTVQMGQGVQLWIARMLEAGVPFSVVSDIMGWSASTAVRMAKRYGHIGHTARRDAVHKLPSATVFDSEGAKKWAQWRNGDVGHVQ